MTEPLISIVMPCYNAEKFISYTIETVLSQTYKNWELLIVDDKSTDNSLKVISTYNDNRIKVFPLSQKGYTHGARNFALDKATGNFIAFLDSDDLWMRDKLEKQINFMTKNNYPLTITDNYMMNINGQIFTLPYKNPKVTTHRTLLLKKSAIHFSSVMYYLPKLGRHYFQEKEPEDFMFVLDLLRATPEAINISEPLTVYRISNPLSNSGNKLQYARKTWKLYRSMNDLNLLQACLCFMHYAVKGVLRYRPYKRCPYLGDISSLNLAVNPFKNVERT